MLSWHPNKASLGVKNHYARGWRIAATDDVQRIANGMVSYAISPAIWSNGHRTKENFIKADWIALDFDEGPSIGEILDALCDHIHVLGTTKSHGIAKGDKPPCDRFRLMLKCPVTITSSWDYEATVSHYVDRYDADGQCIDAARFFWPCREIVSIEPEGYTVDIHRGEEPRKYSPTARPSDSEILVNVPPWVKDWLLYGCPDGERNVTCFKTAIWLTKCGYAEEAIIDMVMSSPIPLDHSHKVFVEVCHAIRSGRKRALSEMARPQSAGGTQ